MATANGAIERGRRVAEDAEEAVTRGVRQAKKAGRQAVHEAEDVMVDVRHRGETMVHDIEAMVAQRPIASVLAAAAVGFVLAKFWR